LIEKMKALALAYHDVIEPGRLEASGFPRGTATRYKLAVADFEQHLEAIATRCRPSVIGAWNARAVAQKPAPVFLTFDDGGASAYTHIADRLEEYGWKGHFFIPARFVDTPAFVSRKQIRELHARGHVIGSHSYSHPRRMSSLPWQELLAEWKESCEALAGIVGRPIAVASVPGGYYSRLVAEAASAAGIRTLFTSEPRTRCRYVDHCLVMGRYAVWRGTPADAAASLVAGCLTLQMKQWLAWNAKKIPKALGGARYLRLRDRLLGCEPA